MINSCALPARPGPDPRAALGSLALLALAFILLALAAPLRAQDLEMVDPDDAFAKSEPREGAIDGDLAGEPVGDSGPSADEGYAFYPDDQGPPPVPTSPVPAASGPAADTLAPADPASRMSADASPAGEAPLAPAAATVQGDAAPAPAQASGETYGEDDLIGAAESVFGRGAEGIARMIEDLLKKEGRPNAYIVGREAGGAFIFGARYGSGTLHHKIEGERRVYWTGPSLGVDAGANAAKTFVLVYNLFDSEDLFERFPAGEGQAYLVGGLHASYVRRGDIVLIPIRLGAGLRLGLNAGYLRFSKKQRWLPF